LCSVLYSRLSSGSGIGIYDKVFSSVDVEYRVFDIRRDVMLLELVDDDLGRFLSMEGLVWVVPIYGLRGELWGWFYRSVRKRFYIEKVVDFPLVWGMDRVDWGSDWLVLVEGIKDWAVLKMLGYNVIAYLRGVPGVWLVEWGVQVFNVVIVPDLDKYDEVFSRYGSIVSVVNLGIKDVGLFFDRGFDRGVINRIGQVLGSVIC